MKNGDQPAMPTGNNQSGTGLTKRETFAMAAMCGILACLDHCEQRGNASVVELSISVADELLKQLEEIA